MSGERASGPDWTVVDEGWGRRAVDFATLSEPANCREYVAVHHMLGAGHGDRLLDVAWGLAWPSSSHPCAVLTARASTPLPGSSPSRGTEVREPTSEW
jgi:hypothetical protein